MTSRVQRSIPKINEINDRIRYFIASAQNNDFVIATLSEPNPVEQLTFYGFMETGSGKSKNASEIAQNNYPDD